MRRLTIAIPFLLLFVWATPAHAQFSKGFDFRATAGAESDPIDSTYVLISDTSPTTRNGTTFQWIQTAGLDSRDRNIGNDARLEGIIFVGNGVANTVIWTLTLPATGSYDIYLAAGDASAGQQIWLEVQDNTTAFIDFNGTATSANNFLDASGANRTASQWVAASARGGTKVTHTFTSTTLRVVLGNGVGGQGQNSTIAHLFVDQVAAVTFPNAPLFRRSQSQ